MLAYTKDKGSRCGILLDGKLRDNFRSAEQNKQLRVRSISCDKPRINCSGDIC